MVQKPQLAVNLSNRISRYDSDEVMIYAGHPPPLILSTNGAGPQTLPLTGLPHRHI